MMPPVTCNKHNFQQLQILVLTGEFAVDLGRQISALGKAGRPCLWPVIDVKTVSDIRKGSVSETLRNPKFT